MEKNQKESIHHQKIFCVITIARQIEGEYVFVKAEKAFSSAQKADEYIKDLKKQYVTDTGQPKVVVVSTPNGAADCICEVGPFELEVEE